MLLIRLRGKNAFCSSINFRSNIGGVEGEKFISHGPIDVVYTWVNGSDPVWKAKKEFWAKKMADPHHHNSDQLNEDIFASNSSIQSETLNATIDFMNNSGFANTTHSLDSLNATVSLNSTDYVPVEENDAETMTANRYRDSEELRYSLRSLIKNAPWIRHIYLVTDNQIPYWLNLESSKLTVLSHENIFANKSHLPVFSSPAIEANLHNIPGISKKFIYFNDDVFLGSPTFPDDFVTLSGAQKFVMAWDVPKCAPGCSDSWIGDGYCDRACNVSECNWDFPDCVNGSNVNPSGYTSDGNIQTPNVYCSKYCPDTWLADKICDQRCKIPECGWDVGDCGLDLVLDGYHGITLDDTSAQFPEEVLHNINTSSVIPNATPDSSMGNVQYYSENPSLVHSQHGTDDYVARNMYGYALDYGHNNFRQLSPALVVPYGTFAIYFNLSMLPCHILASNRSIPTSCNLQNLTEPFLYALSSHDDYSKFVVHQSILLNKHNLLVVTLFHGQENAPQPPFYPYTVTFTVEGSFSSSDMVKMMFSLQIIDPDDIPKLSNYVPPKMGIVESVMGDHVHSVGVPKLQKHHEYSIGANTSQAANSSHNGGNIIQTERVELLKLPIRSEREMAPVCYKGSSHVQEERLIYLLQSEDLFWLLQFAESTGSSASKMREIEFLTNLKVLTTITFQNGTQYLFEECLYSALVQYTLNKVNFEPKSFNHSSPSASVSLSDAVWLLLRNDYRNFLESMLSRVLFDAPAERRALRNRLSSLAHVPRDISSTEESIYPSIRHGGGVLVSIPLPVPWEQLPLTKMHVKVEIGVPSGSDETKNDEPEKCWEFQQLERRNNSLSSRPKTQSSRYLKSIVWTQLVSWGRNMSHPVTEDTATSTIGEDAFATESDSHPQVESSPEIAPDTVAIEVVPPEIDAASREPQDGSSTISSPTEQQQQRRRRLHSSKKRLAHDRGQLHSQDSTIQDTSLSLSLTQSIHKWSRLLWTDVVHPVWSFYTSPFRDVAEYMSAGKEETYAASINQPEEFTGRHRRRLLDTYAQSLIHVNRLYNKAYGIDNRKVPAHVPHMVDREYMTEMQTKWSAEWNATSSHRFRAVDDMQYAFAYYYYVMNRRKSQPPDLALYLSQTVDTNGDKFIDANEWQTLLSIVSGSRFTDEDDLRLSHCVRFPHLYANASHQHVQTDGNETHVPAFLTANISFLHPTRNVAPQHAVKGTVEHQHSHGRVIKTVSYVAYPRLSELLECNLITDTLKTKVDWNIRQPTHHTDSDKDLVAFEMIGDNMTDSMNQLNSIRQRQSKFICVNDNMQNPSAEMTQALRAFFEAMFPTPSIFELPPTQRNPTLYLDEYRYLQRLRARQRNSWLHQLSLVVDVHAVVEVFESVQQAVKTTARHWAYYVLDTEAPPAQSSTPVLEVNGDVEELRRIQQQLRQDLKRDPLRETSPKQRSSRSNVDMLDGISAASAEHETLASRMSSGIGSSSHPAPTVARKQDSNNLWQVHVAAWLMVVGLVLVLGLRMLIGWQARLVKRSHSSKSNPSSSSPDSSGRHRKKQDDHYDADDDEARVLERLRSIERRIYEPDDSEDEKETKAIIARLQQKQPFTKVPLSTPLSDIRTHFPFTSSNTNVNVASHDQVLGYRPAMPAPAPAPAMMMPPLAYPKRFQTITRPTASSSNTNHGTNARNNSSSSASSAAAGAPSTPSSTNDFAAAPSSTSDVSEVTVGGAAEEEAVEEVVVVDDRVYTADDQSYLRKYSAAMLEDAAGTGPGTTKMQLEIFSDGAWRSSRSRSNSESFTANTFPSHK